MVEIQLLKYNCWNTTVEIQLLNNCNTFSFRPFYKLIHVSSILQINSAHFRQRGKFWAYAAQLIYKTSTFEDVYVGFYVLDFLDFLDFLSV